MPQGRDTLEVFDFGLLLQALSQSLKVGALRVRSRLGEKYIYFSRGKLKAIYTRRSRIRIGRILYNLRVIEKKDLKQVVDDQEAGKVDLPLGEELLARGLVSQENLDAAVRYQMMEELLEIFYWKDYSYEFISGAPERSIQSISDDLTRVGGSQDINDLLLNVSRIIDDMEKFNRVIPSVRDVYELTVNPEEYWAREGRSPQLYQLLTIIDGQRDLREILRDMRMNRFAVIELLCRLRVEGIIRPKNSFELLMLGENNLKVFSPEKLERIYQRVRELGVEGFDVSLKLASVNRELGKHQKAAELYVEHAEKALADGESKKAEEGARRAVELFPGSAVMRELLTRVLEKLGMRDELLVELRELAAIHRRDGERVMEEAALQRALVLDPESEGLLTVSAEAHLATGNGRLAARDLFTLAGIRKEKGDDTGAEEALHGAVRAVPGSIRFRNALAGHLAQRGDLEAASKELRILVSTIKDRCALSGRSPQTALRAIRARLEALELQASDASVLLADAFA
ncbi:MAG: tetratricopeptide repeat protein, partial [Planctomycetota bacterium]